MNNLQKHFISYELSKEFKELGFDEPCLGLYHESGQFTLKETDKIVFYNRIMTKAPLISQALEFLREKYGIHVEVSLGHDEDSIWWNTYLFKVEKGYNYDPIINEDIGGDNYEQAQLAGITKAVELIKQK